MVIAVAPQRPQTRQSLVSSRFLNQKELDPDFVDFNSVNRRYHYPARTLVSFRASFLQSDPLVRFVLSSQLGHLVRYGFADCSPSVDVDPTGLLTWEDCQRQYTLCRATPGYSAQQCGDIIDKCKEQVKADEKQARQRRQHGPSGACKDKYIKFAFIRPLDSARRRKDKRDDINTQRDKAVALQCTLACNTEDCGCDGERLCVSTSEFTNFIGESGGWSKLAGLYDTPQGAQQKYPGGAVAPDWEGKDSWLVEVYDSPVKCSCECHDLPGFGGVRPTHGPIAPPKIPDLPPPSNPPVTPPPAGDWNEFQKWLAHFLVEETVLFLLLLPVPGGHGAQFLKHVIHWVVRGYGVAKGMEAAGKTTRDWLKK
jgi:hypothetical protein